MKEIGLEESKHIMLKMLESIDKCCREHNIKYSLCWGTMIGAIRHHGFIPWDDDIDVMLPRSDYNKFIEVYNDSKYGLYSPRNNKNCIQILTKVYDKSTCIFFNNHPKSLFGIWVSLFPYDNVPVDHLRRWEIKRTFWMSLYHFKTVRYLKTDSIVRKIAKFVLKIPVLPFSSFWIYSRVEKILTEYNDKQSDKICIWPADEFTEFDYYPVDLFSELIDVEFDRVRCKLIGGFDKFLRMKYGDYMTFPPEEERVPKHDYKAYYIK